MQTDRSTTFYAICFGNDEYEFFDTHDSARDAAIDMRLEICAEYDVEAYGPLDPTPIAKVEIEPLRRDRLLALLNRGPQSIVRSREVLELVVHDGAVIPAPDRSQS